MYQEPSEVYAGRECLAFKGLPRLSEGDLIRLELDAEAGELNCWWNHCKQPSITGMEPLVFAKDGKQLTFAVGSTEGGDEWSIVRSEDKDHFHGLVDANAAKDAKAASTEAAFTKAKAKATEANKSDGEQADEADTTSAHEATNAAAATGSPPLQSLTAAPDVMPQMLSSDARRVGLQKEDEELLDNSSGY